MSICETASESSVPPLTVAWWDSSRRGDAIAAWRALEQRLGGLPVMCSADWTDVWLAHYGPRVPHRYAVAEAGGRIVGLLLLTRGVEDRDGLFASHAWHFGTAGEPDADSACIEYNALACEPAYRDAFFAEVVRQLQDEADWDELCCEGFAILDAPSPGGSRLEWEQTEKSARWIDLDRVRESGRELVTFFGDSTRKNIRQNLRDIGELDIQVCSTPGEAHRYFDDLIELHQRRWNSDGEPGCYRSRTFTAFHRELIDRLAPARMLVIRVRAGGQTLGATQFFIDRGRALNYQGGRLSNVKKLSPGLITDYACMLECLARGYSACDFMAGDSMHKQRLSTDSTPLVWMVHRRPRWKFAVMDHLRRGRKLARTWMPDPLGGLP